MTITDLENYNSSALNQLSRRVGVSRDLAQKLKSGGYNGFICKY